MYLLISLSAIIISAITMLDCAQADYKTIEVSALPINGNVDKNIIHGPSALNDTTSFVWGASVIKGNEGKYHMLFSMWEAGEEFPKFSDGWLLLSKIAYAVSDYPDEGFIFKKIILKGRIYEGDSTAWDAVSVHNPHIKRFGEKYYLYYTGSHDPGPQPEGSPGEALSKRDRIQQSQKIGVIEFNNFSDLLNGKFERPDSPLLSPRTRVKASNIINPSPEGTDYKPDNIIVVNPSVVFRPTDQKYLLYFKGNLYDPHWKGIHGVAIGNTPTGPFTAMDEIIFDVKMSNGEIASAEDPFVWYHNQYEMFFAVMKDFSGKITGGNPGLAIVKSVDGIAWERTDNPFFMRKEILLNEGDTISVSNLERPQLLIGEIGNPLVLYAACSIGPVGGKTDGSTFNVHINLKSN